MSPEEQGGPDRPPPAHEGRITIEGEQIRPYHSHLVLNFVVKQDGASVYPGRVKLTDPQDRQRVAHEVVAAIAPRANGQCPNAQEVLERFLAIRDEMEESGGGGAAFSARDQLIGLVLQHAELFHDAAKTCYARVTVADHEETYPTESGDVRLWMESLYYQRTGKGLGAQTITDAVSQINAEARFKGPEREVWRRVAPDGAGGCYIDLCDGGGHAVHVVPGRWSVVQNPPTEFIRGPGAKALPLPTVGGDLDRLKGYLNVHDPESWALVKAYLVAGLYPAGPYTVLQFRAEHGAAKTTSGRVIRSLLDPAKAPRRGEPKTSDDLAVAAIHNWLVCFDNLSYIQQWLSDGLCRLCTGAGFEAWQYYTRAEQFLAEATRPVLLTSITECVTSEDLVDRLLPVFLPPIPKSKRRSEKKFWEAFEVERAAIFGALLDRLAGALRLLPTMPEERRGSASLVLSVTKLPAL